MEKMQYVVMKTDDIRTNLATEQYLMNSDKIKPPFMLFYIEKPCIIVGRNQNKMEEIKQKYFEESLPEEYVLVKHVDAKNINRQAVVYEKCWYKIGINSV